MAKSQMWVLVAAVVVAALLHLQSQGGVEGANGIPAFKNLIVIIMENKEYNMVIGNAAAPYTNSLAKQYASAINYHGILHPSLPNYLSMVSGGQWGILSNCNDCLLTNQPVVVDLLENAGISWKAYLESMDVPCSTAFLAGVAPHIYAKKHNPFLYFNQITGNASRCSSHVVPLTQLTTDLATNALPRFTFIVPDLYSDTHDTGVNVGDAWLQQWIPKLMATNQYQKDGVLVLTYDEGVTSTNGDGGQTIHILMSEIYGKKAFESAIHYNHYSFLRTILDAWSLPTTLGAAASAVPMADMFLPPPASPTPRPKEPKDKNKDKAPKDKNKDKNKVKLTGDNPDELSQFSEGH
jgi:hypothetical protein